MPPTLSLPEDDANHGALSIRDAPSPSAPHPAAGPTLLPAPVASLVSLFSKSTTVSIRLGSIIGTAVLDSARAGTLTGLELGRVAVEGILTKAGRDVAGRREDHEVVDWTERGISFLYSSISLTQLILSTSFTLSSTTLSSLADFAQSYVLTLDSIFGSTESSRAIAAIVELIRKEFGDEGIHAHGGEKVGVSDVVAGLSSFAVLQMRARKRSAKEIKSEVVWDVVVAGGGGRVELSGRSVNGSREETVVVTDAGGEELGYSEMLRDPDGVSLESEDEDEDEDDEEAVDGALGLPPFLFSQLPPTAEISVTNSSSTTRRTTIEVIGTNPPDFTPPKDAIIISESSHHDAGHDGKPRYKIVYETVTNNTENKRLKHERGEIVRVDKEMSSLDLGDCPSRILALEDGVGEDAEKLPKKKKRKHKEHKEKSSSRSKDSTSAVETSPRKHSHRTSSGHSSEKKKEREKGKEKEREKEREREKEKEKEKEKMSSFRRALTSSSFSSSSSSKEKKKSSSSHSSRSSGRDQESRLPKPSHRSSPAPRPGSPLVRSTSTRASSPELRFTKSSMSSTYKRESVPPSGDAPMQRRDSYTTRMDSSSSHSRRASPRLDSSAPHPLTASNLSAVNRATSPSRRRALSYVPSIYTLRTTSSQSSLLLEYPAPSSSRPTYPPDHLCRNFAKYMRFASAAYGQNFMRLLGIGDSTAGHVFPSTGAHHAEHHAFSYHTSLPVDTILLSSFTDPDGGYDADGETGTGIPLVHFLCVDHGSKSIVLTCRGTLGLEDVLTDLTCGYAELEIRGRIHRFHKGMLNSALLLLQSRSRLLLTLKVALEEFDGYGLVLCGHSLGGGVAAILSILLSTPTPSGFVTANTRPEAATTIPHGRKIHCYVYGPPALISPSLRKQTRGLITSIVNGNDVVPTISFGIVRDFHSVALAFKEDSTGHAAAAEIRRRVVSNLARRQPVLDARDDDYLWGVLKTLRAGMQADKLYPPGEVWVIERQDVFLKDSKSKKCGPSSSSSSSSSSTSSSTSSSAPSSSARENARNGTAVKGATRVTASVIRDVEKKFGEIAFGKGMFGDHSPVSYELALEQLVRGVCGEDTVI